MRNYTERQILAASPNTHALIVFRNTIECFVVQELIELEAFDHSPLSSETSVSLAELADLVQADPGLFKRLLRVVLASGLVVCTGDSKYYSTAMSAEHRETCALTAFKPGISQQNSSCSPDETIFEIMSADEARSSRFPKGLQTMEPFRPYIGIDDSSTLSVTSLASLLDIDHSDISLRLERLRSVLEVPSNQQDSISLLPLPSPHFLVVRSTEDQSGNWTGLDGTHHMLASCCLRRLNKEGALKMDICGVIRPGTRRVALSTEEVRTHIPPDVAFACSSWPIHVVQSKVLLYDNDEVHRFLKSHLLHWLEALSWLGQLSHAVDHISALLSVAQGDNCTEVTAFLQDCKRFILQSWHRVDLAPLQIYYSAIPLAPIQSIIRSNFYREVPPLWELFPDAPMRWSTEVLRFEAHDGPVSAVAFSPDGHIIASASDNGTIRLWNAATGEQIQTHQKYDSRINAVAFSPDGQFIASALNNGIVRLWNAATNEQIDAPQEHDARVNTVAFSPVGRVVASASDNGTLQLWNEATGEQKKLEGHDRIVNGVAFLSDGQVIASASDNGIVRLWNASTSKQTTMPHEHDAKVNAVAFSQDGQVIAFALFDGTVRLWNAATNEQTQKLEGHEASVNAVDFSSNGQIIASASCDWTVRLWNVATGEQMQKFEGHDRRVNAVAFSPNGQVVVSASDDGTVRLWNATTNEQSRKPEGHNGSIIIVAFSPDGQVVASASHNRTVQLWNVATGEQTQKFEGHDRIVNGVAFSPDGQVIASASRDQTVRLWNASTGEQKQKFGGHDYIVSAIAFSPNGQIIALASVDRTVRLWDAATGEQTRRFEGHHGMVRAVAFSPDGQVIASASEDRTVRLWNAATGGVIQLIQTVGIAKRIAFSMDGKSLEIDNGTFRLETLVPGLIDVSACTTSLEPSGQWLQDQGEDLLWLPYEYRGRCFAVHGKTLVVGQASGAVNIYRRLPERCVSIVDSADRSTSTT